jgi:hypothetical protein
MVYLGKQVCKVMHEVGKPRLTREEVTEQALEQGHVLIEEFGQVDCGK